MLRRANNAADALGRETGLAQDIDDCLEVAAECELFGPLGQLGGKALCSRPAGGSPDVGLTSGWGLRRNSIVLSTATARNRINFDSRRDMQERASIFSRRFASLGARHRNKPRGDQG